MKFRKVDTYSSESECGLFVINLANTGGAVAYTAIRRGMGDGPEILHVERGLPLAINHPDRIAGYRACVAACEERERNGV